MATDVPASWAVKAEKALARMKYDAGAFPALAFVRRKNGLPIRNKLLLTLDALAPIKYHLRRQKDTYGAFLVSCGILALALAVAAILLAVPR